MGVLKAVLFLLGQTGLGSSGSLERPTGVLKAVFFQGKTAPGFLQALNV